MYMLVSKLDQLLVRSLIETGSYYQGIEYVLRQVLLDYEIRITKKQRVRLFNIFKLENIKYDRKIKNYDIVKLFKTLHTYEQMEKIEYNYDKIIKELKKWNEIIFELMNEYKNSWNMNKEYI